MFQDMKLKTKLGELLKDKFEYVKNTEDNNIESIYDEYILMRCFIHEDILEGYNDEKFAFMHNAFNINLSLLILMPFLSIAYRAPIALLKGLTSIVSFPYLASQEGFGNTAKLVASNFNVLLHSILLTLCFIVSGILFDLINVPIRSLITFQEWCKLTLIKLGIMQCPDQNELFKPSLQAIKSSADITQSAKISPAANKSPISGEDVSQIVTEDEIIRLSFSPV